MGSILSKPKVKGPSDEQLAAQKKADQNAKNAEERANRELSSATRASTNRRTGRRLLLAPGRENEIAQLGGGTGQNGGNF